MATHCIPNHGSHPQIKNHLRFTLLYRDRTSSAPHPSPMRGDLHLIKPPEWRKMEHPSSSYTIVYSVKVTCFCRLCLKPWNKHRILGRQVVIFRSAALVYTVHHCIESTLPAVCFVRRMECDRHCSCTLFLRACCMRDIHTPVSCICIPTLNSARINKPLLIPPSPH